MTGKFISHYKILSELGSGATGVVYLARDTRLDRDVAIKLIQPGIFSDSVARQKFLSEAQLLASLNHPSIETVFDFGTYQGQEFIVLEYIPGKSLREILTGLLTPA